MSDQPLSEVEEQIDFDGDNDIEEMMDDEGDDPAEDDDDYAEAGIGEDNSGVEGGKLKVDGVDFSQQHQDSDKTGIETNASEGTDSKEEEDKEKRAELLALPPHGSEVFVGGIPRDATEEDLVELCQPFGEVYEVRLVKDKDKKENKGYAFITYSSRESAQRAAEEIPDKEYKGKKLRCSQSQSKHRLFVGNIPKNMSEEEIRGILEETGPGVENVEFIKDPSNPLRNRGFIFVEYYNHACADYSRQKMSVSSFNLEGAKPTVNWADQRNASDSPASSQVKAVYIKNLPESVSSDKMKELFERHGEITKVVLPSTKAGQTKDFGFVHFAERSSALKAVKTSEKYEIDGQVLEVTLAKPQSEKKLDYSVNAGKPGLLSSYPPHSGYGYGGYGAPMGFGQPMIYGRGPMPPGMRMVPMMLPDGRVGYVLQQPGLQPPLMAPPRRGERGGGSSESGSRSSERNRRYRPY